MKKTTYIIICILVLALSATSCLKSYVAEFDQSSAERMEEFLSEIKDMLIAEPYGWQMDYFVGNEEEDRGGINLVLKFGEKKDEVVTDTVRVMSEEDETAAVTSRYVLRSDSGPVLAFDTFNSIIHKYGTPSSSDYEGRGGDYEFFITGYDKTSKTISLKGKRNGKICVMRPLSVSIEDFNAQIYNNSRNFYISTFEGFIGEKKVTGEVDVTTHQFIAYEMEIYGYDEKTGEPLYDIAATRETPYILTDKGIRFYEPIKVFDKELTEMDFNFDLPHSDTTLTNGDVKFKAYIPEDWLPYEFYEGTWTLTYGTNSMISNIQLVPEERGFTYRVKGMSTQFDLIMNYVIRSGRIELRYQAPRKPGTDDTFVKDDHLLLVLLPWSLNKATGTGGLWMNPSIGMMGVWNKNTTNPLFNWKNNEGGRNFDCTSFLLYYYDTDDAAESPYYGEANEYKFAGTGGNGQLAYLATFRKTK